MPTMSTIEIHDPALAETWCDGQQWGRTLRSTSIATITTT
jgi:hypothetical protein